MSIGLIILVVTISGGIYMAWNIGANDVANAMGTSVGSGALTLAQAVVLAGVFEFAGAVLVGSHVTDTVRGKIIEVAMFQPTGPLGANGPLLLALGMVSALFAAGIWLHFSTWLSLPVSTTHSIVGAIVGVGLVTLGMHGVDWGTVGNIVASWVVSPILGAVIAYAAFILIRRRILEKDDPVEATRRTAPYLIFAVITLLFLSFIYKALKNVVAAPPFVLALAMAVPIGVGGGLITRWGVRRTQPQVDDPYKYVERVFGRLQIITALYVAFAHGANDVANAIGPLAAVANLAREGFAQVATRAPVPFWVLALGGAGIVIGLGTYGYRVIQTVGGAITEITPTRGFSAEFGAATTVLIASRMGLPISTTHTLVGAVIGVGLAHGMGALNFRVIRNIVNSWIATVPAGAILAAGIFVMLRALVL
ncbi:MAG: inorganic phosphate transporter [Gemmatimonadota bacterium]|jgi:inorganic phosphate transporter, PiT family